MHSPCSDGWAKLLTNLGKTKPDDDPLSILTILESNGIEDAIWCLRAIEGRDKTALEFALGCARMVEHLSDDARVKACNDTLEAFMDGKATGEQLIDAWDAARDAWDAWDAWDAAGAAGAAASAAASAAARAAWDAAWDAAGAAAGATWDAAWDAARAAARDAQANLLIMLIVSSD